jgi:alpha-glucosidase
LASSGSRFMFAVSFDSASRQENSLCLVGRRSKATITCLKNGVWRLQLGAHSCQEKLSAANDNDIDYFSSKTKGDRWILTPSIQQSKLSFTINPFQFSWLNLSFSVQHGRRRADGKRQFGAYQLLWLESHSRRYYGLGERTGFLDKRGRQWVNWTTDEPHHTPHADPLYQAHPFVMAADGDQYFGLFVDESWRTRFDLACSSKNQSLIEADGPTLDLYLIPGPGPQEVLSRYTDLVGRAPAPPLWALGYHQCRWGYKNEADIRELMHQFRSRDIPCDALWLDIDYMDGYKSFTFSPLRFPDIQQLTADLRNEGLKVVAIVDPGVKKEDDYPVYESGKERGAFVTDSRDQELVGEVWPKQAVWPDFLRDDVQRWWGSCHKAYTDAGIAGIWNDMNEPAVFSIEGRKESRDFPLDARHGTRDHEEVHNFYGHSMAKATFEGMKRLRPEQRPFVLTRSGFAGIQKYAWVWTGDNASSWEHLEMSIPMLLNLGMSGVPFCGADIGGFFENCNEELLIRWMWLGVFYPFMRNHSGRNRIEQEPWAFGERTSALLRQAIVFRYRLMPYLYTLVRQSCVTGLPLMRALFLHYPDDEETYHLYDQFLFGKDLLVAPALRPGQRKRLVYLPDEWQAFWTGAKSQTGSSWHVSPTPLSSIPLFQRCGTAIPMTEAQSFTSSAHWKRLRWSVALGDVISGKVYEDEGDGYNAGITSWVEGRFDGRELQLDFHDKSAEARVIEFEILGMSAPSKASTSFQLSERGLLVEWSGEPLVFRWD